MPTISNIARGTLVLTGIPDNSCFTSWQDFIQSIPQFLGVEVPSSVSNVVVSNVQPNDSQTQSVWFRLSNSGSFLGIYVFSQGAWHAIYPVNTDTTTEIFWLFGDSASPPAGWQNTDDYTGISAAVKTALKAQWVLEGSVYTYYSAVFISF